jgi:GAF domain-containing protein
MADSTSSAGDGFAALSQFFLSDGTLGDTLLRVAELACEASSSDFAGITLLVNGRVRTGVFTDPASPEIDAAQYESGKGPCLDAFRHNEVCTVESTEDDHRWPEFSRAAAEHGIASTLSVPIVARKELLGALNLYSRQPSRFDEPTVEHVENFAAHAAVVLANAQVFADARELNEGLNQALNSRATIDHAVGILMAPGGRSPDDAFQILVRASQRENRKLRDIAAEIVQRTIVREPHRSTHA